MHTEPDDRTGAGSAVGVVADAAGAHAAEAGQVTNGDPTGSTTSGATSEYQAHNENPSGIRGLRRRRTAFPVFIAALALASVAFLCAGAFGGWWASVGLSNSTKMASMRDDVLRAGETGVQNFNTLDYRNVDAGLNLWLQSSTGTLYNDINSGRANFKTQIQQAKTITTAKILDGAVTELDDNQCKASVIVAVQVTVTPATGTPKVEETRIQGDMGGTPANGGCSNWKLSSIGQVPVGSGSSSTSGAPAPSGSTGSATTAPSTTSSTGH
ncbi:MAG TPA: hypothetical protein VG317_06270 [Pseudonocardiaceae bacterium]|nr:hypothetical protein [Pseudonocardiaceae bacterium]